MAYSRKKLLESKGVMEDVMPYENWRLPEPQVNIIMEYAIDIPLLTPCLFSGSTHALLKTLFLAKHAGPLDKFIFFASSHILNELKNNFKKNMFVDKIFIMDDMQGTLIQLLVSRLDVSLRNDKGDEIEKNKGMAETLINIIAELLPHRLAEVLKQAETAAPFEVKKIQQEREFINRAAINLVFDAIKQDNKKMETQGIATFKEFIKNKKSFYLNSQGYLSDNRYYRDLLHIMSVAFEILANRGGELPRTNANDYGSWYGKKADLFCFKVIGESLQREFNLSPRLRQLLSSELYYVLNTNRMAERTIDTDGYAFLGTGSKYSLGINFYYDEWTRAGSGQLESRLGETGVGVFRHLLRAITPRFNTYARQLAIKENKRCVIT